ncbi:MAG: hypothetical protein COA44_01970 [Arcobacter sp.]|nr:MAG: hypothetical protein COA44_01970 [Arcobacter sp.]
MKPLCFSKVFLLLLIFSLPTFANLSQKSAAVYYGKDISYTNLGLHDYIIVESDNISPYTHGFKSYKKKIYAYVSIGEANEYKKYFKGLKKKWKLSKNKKWNSIVMDISNDDYHEYMYNQVIQPLIDKGYENFFFDTLDSYQIIAKSQEDRRMYELGLIRFIKKFKVRFKDSKLIVNRGFEVLDEIYKDLDALLFESVFYGLSSKYKGYKRVSAEDRTWLLSHVQKAQAYGLDVIGVDYIDLTQKEKIKDTIAKIQDLGIIPYISNKEFTRYGDSSKEVLKREILVLYSEEEELENTNAHKLAAIPLEYLGYIPILKAIEQGLPSLDELSRYKAVLVWNGNSLKEAYLFEKWVSVLLEQKIKVLFLDGFGVNDDTNICKILDIKKQENKASILDKEEITYQDKSLGFETPLSLSYFQSLYQPQNAQELLGLKNIYAQENIPIAITSWGGYALNETVTHQFEDNILWVLNPFRFFKEALGLESIPIPDPTTQNGKRLLFTHIDGDASMNKAEWDPRSYSIGVMYEKILKKYKIPQGVSIVEAETNPNGLYPKDSKALEEIARKIYKLPYIEAATHTYTHPFAWKKIKDGKLDEKYRLKIKGYDFSIDREIMGSLSYINTRLLPKDKKRARTVYWTGDCSPAEDVLEYTYKHNLLNINGGDTIITNDKPWLFLVAPYGIKRGEYIQVYTGAENENVYTNDWRGPFWGYQKVIQTFELTNKPRRLKPIDIYYHFYAASKIASLNALDKVYKYALSQDVFPIYTSEYIPKVLEFYDVSISKERMGWNLYGMDHLKTLRLDTKNPKIRYENSQSVLGQKTQDTSSYIHLNTNEEVIRLNIGKSENENYLISTNAKVLDYQREEKDIHFTLKGYLPLTLKYHLKKECTLNSGHKPREKIVLGSGVEMKFTQKETDVFIQCR